MTINADSQPTVTTRPDGDVLTSGYDLAGRLQSLTIPRGVFSYSYDGTTGKLTGVSGPGGATRSHIYQGALLSSVANSGSVSGNVSWTYDNNFRTTSRSVNGDNTIAFQFDSDDLSTAVGPLTMTRDAQNGLITGTTLGVVTDHLVYNEFGEVTGYEAFAGSNPIYSENYTRDKLGRITHRVETIEGVTTTWDYGYDLAGRLERVDKNGVLSEAYTYDLNDNRLSKTTPAGTTVYSYDDQDRLLASAGPDGPVGYVWDANGDLVSKTDSSGITSYDYDAKGQLLSVTKPNGDAISYEFDASNRRAAMLINGASERKWIYGLGLLPVAEFDASDSLVATYAPGYMTRAGRRFRVLRDHVGSVREVVDDATGQLVQVQDFDAWGNSTKNTYPDFQPFGFAGGLTDNSTGIVRFGVRDYESNTGRFLSRDLIGPMIIGSTYSYCRQDPINRIDPTGLAEVFLGYGVSHGQDDVPPSPITTDDVEIFSNKGFQTTATTSEPASYDQVGNALANTTELMWISAHSGGVGIEVRAKKKGYNATFNLKNYTGPIRPKIIVISGCNSAYYLDDLARRLQRGQVIIATTCGTGSVNEAQVRRYLMERLASGQSVGDAVTATNQAFPRDASYFAIGNPEYDQMEAQMVTIHPGKTK